MYQTKEVVEKLKQKTVEQFRVREGSSTGGAGSMVDRGKREV